MRVFIVLAFLAFPFPLTGQDQEELLRIFPDQVGQYDNWRMSIRMLRVNKRTIRKELSLTEEQEEQLAEFYQSQENSRFNRARRISLKDSHEFAQSDIKELQECIMGVEEKLKEILLDNQVQRLQQIGLQWNRMSYIESSGLLHPKELSQFKIEDATRAKIKRVRDNIRRDIIRLAEKQKEERMDLMTKRDEAIRNLLSDSQKELFDSRIGKPTTYPIKVWMLNETWILMEKIKADEK